MVEIAAISDARIIMGHQVGWMEEGIGCARNVWRNIQRSVSADACSDAHIGQAREDAQGADASNHVLTIYQLGFDLYLSWCARHKRDRGAVCRRHQGCLSRSVDDGEPGDALLLRWQRLYVQ